MQRLSDGFLAWSRTRMVAAAILGCLALAAAEIAVARAIPYDAAWNDVQEDSGDGETNG